MSPPRRTGPRPQRVEVENAIDAIVEETASALGALTGLGADPVRDALRSFTLRLLEAVGVDSGGVTITSKTTPVAQRVRRTE